MSKLHELFEKRDAETEVNTDETVSTTDAKATIEETSKVDGVQEETKEETKKDFMDEILKGNSVSFPGAYDGYDETEDEERVRKEYFQSHSYPYIPNPLGIRSNNPWYGAGKGYNEPPITGIRFRGFIKCPGVDVLPTDTAKYNERMKKVMGNLSGTEIDILSKTTLMHSKDEVQRYIDIITKLINMGIID